MTALKKPVGKPHKDPAYPFEVVRDVHEFEREWSEHQHQVALFAWVDTYLMIARARKDRALQDMLESIFAVPNGGERNALVGMQLRREGVRKGVPDIFVDVPMFESERDKGGKLVLVPGLRIELKALTSRSKFRHPHDPSPEQVDRLARYARLGYRAVLCVGWRAAQKVICEYLGVKP